MTSEKRWESRRSRKLTLCRGWDNPNLYLEQPITKGWCQAIGGHVLYPTDSLTVTMLDCVAVYQTMSPYYIWLCRRSETKNLHVNEILLVSFLVWWVEKLASRGPFYEHGLTLIPAWISHHMPSKMWDEITYPLTNFNGATVEVWSGWVIYPTLYNGYNYLSMLGSKLIHVN